MARKTIPLPAFTPPAAGSETTLVIPIRPTYERIMLEYSGMTLAQMKNVELRINGNPIQTFSTAEQLDALNKFYKRPEDAGFITLWFEQKHLANLAQRRLCSLGTQNVQTASLHIEVASDAAAPAIKAHAVVTAPRPLTHAVMIKQFPHNSAVSGQIDIDNIVKNPTMRPMAMHFFKSDISDIEVELDNVKMYDASKSLGEAIQKQNGRAPQTASATHVDWIGDNDIQNALVNGNASDFRVKPTLDSSGETKIVVEYFKEFVAPKAA